MMLSLITLQIANISITMSDELVNFAIVAPVFGLGTIGIIMLIALSK